MINFIYMQYYLFHVFNYMSYFIEDIYTRVCLSLPNSSCVTIREFIKNKSVTKSYQA